MWETGETMHITVEEIEGTHDRVSTTYKNLAATLSPATASSTMAGYYLYRPLRTTTRIW
jgi:imidazoleglycerol phosphate dehydratase HisB